LPDIDELAADSRTIELSKRIDMEQATTAILRMALVDQPLDVLLGSILDLILAIPWLSLESRGGILLTEDSDVLVMRATRNLPDVVVESCQHVSFGSCLCGITAETQLLQYSNCIDKRHSRLSNGSDHGHYCVPIVADNTCLGVLVLYIDTDHVRDETEEKFLGVVADTLAGILIREKTDERREESEAQLTAIFDAFDGLLYVCSSDMTVEYMNKRFIDLIGKDPVGGICYREIHKLESPCPWCTNDRVLAGETARWEVQFEQDGRDYLVLNRPLVHADGSVSKLSMSTDVTDLKQTQRKLEETVSELEAALSGVVEALSSTTSQRDPYTSIHQERVARLACAVARKMGLDEESVEGLRTAGLLHDIGKIAVPSDILNRPGTLNEMEMGIVHTHPHIGYTLLEKVPFDQPIALAVLQHHERLDGSGYPDGLHETEILLEAKILTVVDVLEAMVSRRPYRSALGISAAIEELKRLSGVELDADVVAATLEVVSERGFEL